MTKTTNKKQTTNITKKAVATEKSVATPITNNEIMNPPSVFDNKELCTDMKKSVNAIKKEIKSVETSSLKIAFELYHIYDKKGYQVLGAKDIYELGKKEFGLARGTVNGWINVVDSFAKRDDKGNVLPEIQEQFAKFSMSQLLVMQNMTTDALLEIKPEMSVRDIKKLKKGDTDTDTDNEESDNEVSGIKVKEVEVPQRQVMVTVSTLEEYDSKEDDIYNMIKRALAVKKGESAPKYKVEISYIW